MVTMNTEEVPGVPTFPRKKSGSRAGDCPSTKKKTDVSKERFRGHSSLEVASDGKEKRFEKRAKRGLPTRLQKKLPEGQNAGGSRGKQHIIRGMVKGPWYQSKVCLQVGGKQTEEKNRRTEIGERGRWGSGISGHKTCYIRGKGRERVEGTWVNSRRLKEHRGDDHKKRTGGEVSVKEKR